METLVRCDICGLTMDGRSCAAPFWEIEGQEFERIPYDLSWNGDSFCPDCRTHVNGLHHPGCDVERCPRCNGQAISCGCRWAGDVDEVV